ncbi:MAG: DUF4271 domain-containing protein, partial [Paludibacter sp.]|nr:DUF4271 domain-containing protein [Paludibacter sp.]
LLLLYAHSFSMIWVKDSIKTFFRVQERVSIFAEQSINSFKSRFFMITFSILVIAMYIYTLMFNDSFGFYNFALICGITSAYYIIKRFIGEIIGYVFLNKSTLKIARESYMNIVSYMGFILFPLLVLQIYLPLQCLNFIKITAIIVCMTMFLLFVIKLFLIFFHKKLAFLYIMLYLCTLEILPLFFLFKAFQAVI